MTIDELKKFDALISGKPAMPPERIDVLADFLDLPA